MLSINLLVKMIATCTDLVIIIALLTFINCEDNATENETTTEFFEDENMTTILPSTTEKVYTHWGYRGLYGGSYYNKAVSNPDNIHWIHGTYQPATEWYYNLKNYFEKTPTNNSFDYYIGYGLSKITDSNFKYDNYHYYGHNINRTIGSNDTIDSDQIMLCHPNSTLFCPENTETICLFNGTIYCMSKISIVLSCPDNALEECIITAVPCVRSCQTADNNLKMLSVRCLGRVTIKDVYADGRGNTIARVGKTFILVPAFTLEERTFCVTIIVDPVPPG